MQHHAWPELAKVDQSVQMEQSPLLVSTEAVDCLLLFLLRATMFSDDKNNEVCEEKTLGLIKSLVLYRR